MDCRANIAKEIDAHGRIGIQKVEEKPELLRGTAKINRAVFGSRHVKIFTFEKINI